jgi:hypothetical protein
MNHHRTSFLLLIV